MPSQAGMGLVGVARAATEEKRVVLVRGRVEIDGEDKAINVDVEREWPMLPPPLEALVTSNRCCWTFRIRSCADEAIIALIQQEGRREKVTSFFPNPRKNCGEPFRICESQRTRVAIRDGGGSSRVLSPSIFTSLWLHLTLDATLLQ